MSYFSAVFLAALAALTTLLYAVPILVRRGRIGRRRGGKSSLDIEDREMLEAAESRMAAESAMSAKSGEQRVSVLMWGPWEGGEPTEAVEWVAYLSSQGIAASYEAFSTSTLPFTRRIHIQVPREDAERARVLIAEKKAADALAKG